MQRNSRESLTALRTQYLYQIKDGAAIDLHWINDYQEVSPGMDVIARGFFNLLPDLDRKPTIADRETKPLFVEISKERVLAHQMDALQERLVFDGVGDIRVVSHSIMRPFTLEDWQRELERVLPKNLPLEPHHSPMLTRNEFKGRIQYLIQSRTGNFEWVEENVAARALKVICRCYFYEVSNVKDLDEEQGKPGKTLIPLEMTICQRGLGQTEKDILDAQATRFPAEFGQPAARRKYSSRININPSEREQDMYLKYIEKYKQMAESK
jgi:hypothetical protein